MLRQYELVEKVRAYDPDADEGLINRAYVFSMKAHGSQVRASGDPYFSHPIEVAGILTDLKLDDQTIATAILHDTIEDTLATPEEIERLFGGDVARLHDAGLVHDVGNERRFVFFGMVFFSSAFLAFATIFPEQVINLFGVIPIKAKWLGWVDAAGLVLAPHGGELRGRQRVPQPRPQALGGGEGGGLRLCIARQPSTISRWPGR